MGRRILLLSLVVVCGLAIGCGVPSSTPTPPTPSQTASGNLESYWVSSAGYEGEWMTLKTIGSWEGGSWKGGESDIFFKATKTPWVVNAGYTNADKWLTPTFQVFVQSEQTFRSGSSLAYSLNPYGVIYEGTFEGTGDYVIRVVAYGCEWWVKVGVEP